MDEVSGVDTDKRLVRLKQDSISYDYLVLATGIQYNYFGHDEWRRVAPGLESLDDADLIRGKILLAFERAEEMAALGHADIERIRQLLTFVLVGAGTVGVEMASTLAELSRIALAHDFRQIDPRDAQIHTGHSRVRVNLHAQALEMTLRLRRQIFGKCRKHVWCRLEQEASWASWFGVKKRLARRCR